MARASHVAFRAVGRCFQKTSINTQPDARDLREPREPRQALDDVRRSSNGLLEMTYLGEMPPKQLPREKAQQVTGHAPRRIQFVVANRQPRVLTGIRSALTITG